MSVAGDLEIKEAQYDSMKNDLERLGNFVATVAPELAKEGVSVVDATLAYMRRLDSDNKKLEKDKDRLESKVIAIKASCAGLANKIHKNKKLRERLDKALKNRKERHLKSKRNADHQLQEAKKTIEVFTKDFEKLNKFLMETGKNLDAWGNDLVDAAIDHIKALEKAAENHTISTVGSIKLSEFLTQHTGETITPEDNLVDSTIKCIEHLLEQISKQKEEISERNATNLKLHRSEVETISSYENQKNALRSDLAHVEACRRSSDRKTKMCRELLKSLKETMSSWTMFPDERVMATNETARIDAMLEQTKNLHPSGEMWANADKILKLEGWVRRLRKELDLMTPPVAQVESALKALEFSQ